MNDETILIVISSVRDEIIHVCTSYVCRTRYALATFSVAYSDVFCQGIRRSRTFLTGSNLVA